MYMSDDIERRIRFPQFATVKDANQRMAGVRSLSSYLTFPLLPSPSRQCKIEYSYTRRAVERREVSAP